MTILIPQIFHFLSSNARGETNSGSSFFVRMWSGILDYQDYILLLISIIVIVYIFEWAWYGYKYKRYINLDNVYLGQITILGELESILSPEQVALVIRSEFSAINQCLDIMQREQLDSCPTQTSSLDYYFFFSGLKDNTCVTRQITAIPTIYGLKKKPFLQTNITLELGSIKIPVSDILRSVVAFVGLLPVPPRNRYNDSLIHVSLISHEKNAKVVVHRAGAKNNDGPNVLSVTSLYPFQSIDELNLLLRDIAFMVLELHNAFGECNWKSMRYLIDGFNEFCNFRKSGLLDDRNNAKEFFHKALLDDPENNLEALYYYSVMLMVERTTDAIEMSINYFKSALRSENPRLKFLVNLGLAFCYAQSYHRLGKKNYQMIVQANDALEKAETYWRTKQQKQNQKSKSEVEDITVKDNINSQEINQLPLIPYINALILFIEAEYIEDNKKKENVFNNALQHAHESIQLDPLNSMFINNMGWALMKLAEAGIEVLQKNVIPGYKERKTAVLAKNCLQEALILNPKNKLTHANLCLLYSIPFYIKLNKNDGYDLIYLQSRYHGLKAIAIDPNYINGYRDLCIAYIRYGKEEQADKCFHKALEIAENPFKDAEIFTDINNEAKDNNISKKMLKRWSVPLPELFEPHL